jgi:hypothetical protein
LIKKDQGNLAKFANELLSDGIFTTIVKGIWAPLLAAVAVLFVYGFGVCYLFYKAGESFSAKMQAATVVAIVTTVIFSQFNDQIMPILNIHSGSTDPTAYRAVFGYSAFQIMLLKLAPGPDFLGPITPAGNRPTYRDNGLLCFFLTLASFAAFTHPASPLKFFEASIVYDYMEEIIGTCNAVAFAICLLLNIKGRVAPTTNDNVLDQSFIMSFYW